MGPTPPRVFLNVPKNVAITGMLPPLTTATPEGVIRCEIADLIKAEGGAYGQCQPGDFEFVRVSRTTAQLPTVKEGYCWDGSAIKNLARQGSVYVRLTKPFAVSEVSEDNSAASKQTADGSGDEGTVVLF